MVQKWLIKFIYVLASWSAAFWQTASRYTPSQRGYNHYAHQAAERKYTSVHQLIKWLVMTDSYKEQRPLLCDDYSDEEFDIKNYNFQRRKRPSVCSGRARNYAKGAAAVITRWPDNCTTSVAYWWLGVSMIAIIIFVIYNSVLIFGMIPTVDVKEPKYRIFNNEIKPKTQVLSVPDVYMHIINNDTTGLLLNKYLPYTIILSKKYPSFKYKILVLLNDTLNDFSDYKDEERNEIAFNSLWTKEKINKKISSKYNIFVEYISLTAYLNDSPIKKFWRQLPPHLIEFLVRSVSIWEKGGIAFNPKILVPNLYDRRYVDKLNDILNIYVNSSNKSDEKKIKEKFYAGVNTKRPNNIQDILNNLEKYDNNNISKIDLNVAENNSVDSVTNTKNIFKFKRDSEHSFEMGENNKSNFKENSYVSDINLNHRKNNNISNSTNNTHVPDNILPLFLKYLFDNKPQNLVNTPDVIHLKTSKANSSLFNNSINLSLNQSLQTENILKVSVKPDDNNGSAINYKESSNIKQLPVDNSSFFKINSRDNLPELSVDIKGNIIASKTACHAFLGTMFSNVFRHTQEESLTDFIISELSLFCNGLLTSCAGVNVILV